MWHLHCHCHQVPPTPERSPVRRRREKPSARQTVVHRLAMNKPLECSSDTCDHINRCTRAAWIFIVHKKKWPLLLLPGKIQLQLLLWPRSSASVLSRWHPRCYDVLVFLYSRGKHLPSPHRATCRESGENGTSPRTGFQVGENCQGICMM